MKHIKTTAIIIVYIGIYYVFQIVDSVIVEIQAIIKGMSQAESLDYASKNMGIILIPAMIISLVIYFFILKARKKNIFNICKPRKVGKRNIMLIILMVAGYSLALSAISVYVMKYFPSYNETSKSLSMGMTSWIGIIAVVISAPIFEEILFRGIILTEIRENLKVVPAVIIQAIAFGIYHLNPFQGIYASILALVLGYVCVKTKTIVGSITGHMTFNICGSFIFPVLVGYTAKYSIYYIILGIVVLLISTFYFNKGYEAAPNDY
jgi:membrane protease YdiL (CAAX protease family)